MEKRWPFLSHFYVKFMDKIWPKAPQYYSASFWTNNFWICLWENPQTPQFLDFGISGRVPDSPNQILFIFGVSKIPRRIQEQSQTISDKYYFCKRQHVVDPIFCMQKTGTGNPDDPSNKFSRILDMGSISS